MRLVEGRIVETGGGEFCFFVRARRWYEEVGI